MTKPFVVGFEGEMQTRSGGKPSDWRERKKALDIQQSWIVEAPAGSGKTGLLIQRYLKLLGDASVEQPEQVLAITFTVKATGEVRERVLAQLERAYRNEPTGESEFERETRSLAEAVVGRDRNLKWGLLEHPRRLKVQTIDSVCAEIARSLPVLSGGGGQVPVEDAAPLYREAARQTLMQLGGSNATLNDALRTLLLHRDGNLMDCQRLLADMLALRDQWGELVPLHGGELSDDYLDGTVLPQLQQALEQAICGALTQLETVMPSNLLQELTLIAMEMAHLEGYNGSASPIAMCTGRHETPEAKAIHLAHWRALAHLIVSPSQRSWRKGFNKNQIGFNTTAKERERLRPLVEELQGRDDVLNAICRLAVLPPAEYPQEQWFVAKALFRVLSRALAELQIVFAEREECDFAELGLLARTALRHDGAVDDLAAALGMKLQHLLVDEMQDTSTSQYELIELLTQGWDGHSQTVFLVGDPKQSIYLFRQARVERFVWTMLSERLDELPVGCLRLMANFRSQGGLVEQLNKDFSLLFPSDLNAANPEEVPYIAASAVRASTRSSSESAVWHGSVLPPGLTEDELRSEHRRQSRVDARSIRLIIEQWRARSLPMGRSEPWKIAVLVRSRSHLTDIVAALKESGGAGMIPFRAVEIEALRERQEVLDLFALTRALLHPADRVAWLAVLHAPWCGLGLAELHLLSGADDPAWAERAMEDVISERGHLLTEESCQRLARLWPVLRKAVAQRSLLTAAQLVERTWRSLGGDASLQPMEMANARRYLQLLDEVDRQTGTIDPNLLTQRLGRLFAETDTSPGAVDLMTIHGAKGLEWDVVIVPSLEKRARSNSRRLLTWNEISSNDETAAHVVLAPITGKGEGSRRLNEWLNSIQSARDAAERKRLFYVACTRAREELHLFAAPEAKANGEISLQAGSLLRTAWPAAEAHFAATAISLKKKAGMLVMPAVGPVGNKRDEFVGDMAALEDKALQAPIIQRLPLAFDALARFAPTLRFTNENAKTALATHFERPEGSFEARGFGNASHAFLEHLTKRLGEGAAVDALLHEIEDWQPRIAAVLRAEGLPPALIEKRSVQLKSALRNVLQDAEGRWVLTARDESLSEFAVTSWTETRRSVRLDRVFRAGPKPLAPGRGCLWIVDYKTTASGTEGIERFLGAEREKYEAQMEAYARTVKAVTDAEEIRVGLYYPRLPRFVWWTPVLL